MTTITMPREFDSAVQEIIGQAQAGTVQALAEKYGFDPKEAQAFLTEAGTKVVKMRGPVPKAKASKASKATKEASGEPKTKRTPTGYLMFSADQRPQVKEEMTEALAEGTKLSPQAVVKQLAGLWKALDEEERLEWNQMAAARTGECEPMWNQYRLPDEAPPCTHTGQCSCGW